MITDYVAVDLEMTGVDPRKDQILEIGAVKCRAGRPLETFARLIRPSVPIPEPVARLTGITEEMAAGGADADRAMEEFFRFAEELPLVGHQLMCDYSFLKQWAVDHRRPFERQGLDTLKLARKFLPKDQKKNLEELKALYGIREESHRALPDARAAADLLGKLAENFEETDPGAFVPKTLQCRVRRQTPATAKQKEQLRRYLEHFGLSEAEVVPDWERLTRSEASRKVDRIISRYGRLPGHGDR